MIDEATDPVLCFGDSNTWGYNPQTGGRMPRAVRWPGRLEGLSNIRVIEEGLRGRTTVKPDLVGLKSAAEPYFSDCLATHLPLSLVVIMLGTNDLKAHQETSVEEIVRHLLAMADRVVEVGVDVLIVPPPRITTLHGRFEAGFVGAIEKSEALTRDLIAECRNVNVPCFHPEPDHAGNDFDPIHLDTARHAALADALAPVVRGMVAGNR
ncbi:GDSL-type esterase/lipase family protein [Boseongicola sp. H5]|uniref:GDSL-type esterase/lipase family protein n=1 Tax=Boseongicola sp. H5 TaxID=2763261 RepID=UPI001D0AF038|nr:GDSL-type esterase/lipase family protein [Boseongicola sp. H5]